MEIAGLILFCLILLAGVAVIPFNIPGTFVIVGDALVYGALTGFSKYSWTFVLILLVLAVLVEVIEGILGAAAAKWFGGSKYGMAGAIVGGMIGAMIGVSVNPFIGPLLMGFAGCFLGAMLFHGLHSGNWKKAVNVGLGAFCGAVGGKLTKVLVAIIMVIMVCVRVF